MVEMVRQVTMALDIIGVTPGDYTLDAFGSRGRACTICEARTVDGSFLGGSALFEGIVASGSHDTYLLTVPSGSGAPTIVRRPSPRKTQLLNLST